MSEVCIHAFVSGRVQGVWYRQSTKQKASSLGVTGWAKNLADSRVEVMLCGEAEAVQQVVAWLHLGPVRARVERVETRVVDWQAIAGFSTS